MTVQTIKVGGRQFVIVPKSHYDRLCAQAEQTVRLDRADAAEAARRLKDPKEKRVPWTQLKKKARPTSATASTRRWFPPHARKSWGTRIRT